MIKKFFQKLFLLIYLIAISQQQVLFYQAFTSTTITSIESWTITNSQSQPAFQNCNADTIMGGNNKFGLGSSATYILDLPAHYKIRISMNIYLIDSWDNEYFQVYVDQTKAFELLHDQSTSTPSICGGSSNGLYQAIQFDLDHNFRNAFIMITSTLDQLPNDESWGFRDFQLYIYACPTGCLICTSGESYSDCSVWDLVTSSQTSLVLTSFWVGGWRVDVGSPSKHSCSMMPVICGPSRCGQGTKISMTITLPQHVRMKVRFKYIKIDTWRTGDKAYLNIDGTTRWTQELVSLTQYSQNICGQTAVDLVLNVELTISHTTQSSTFLLRNTLDEGFTVQAFGFRDFEIFTTMTKETVVSTSTVICGDSDVQGTEECDDGNLIPFDGCFFCQFSCSDGCIDCLNGVCINCNTDWELDSENNCIYQQKNWNYQEIESQCQDNNIQPFDGCFNNQYSCVFGCKECINGLCVFCEDGFEFNEYNHQCESICGDLQIQIDEQCDNNQNNCDNCQLQCSEYCQFCLQGICQVCQSGYTINSNSQCEQIFNIQIEKHACSSTCMNCLDGLCIECQENDSQIWGQCLEIYQDDEQQFCDVNQFGIDKKCEQSFTQEYQLCPLNCMTCFDGICLECEEGYKNILGQCQEICSDSGFSLLTILECQCDLECIKCKYGICYECDSQTILDHNQCLGICGNGMIQKNEECDDGNDEEFDGCFNCLYSCPKNCKNCVQGQCFDQCTYGYYSINGKCVTMCGDSIIAGTEQCDDGNSDQFDGCYNCQFKCPQFCQDCVEGLCLQCDQGLNLINNQCLNNCGDGIVYKTEECDDNNLINGDGCSNLCQVEIDWVCQNGTYCLFQKYPSIVAKAESSFDSKQIVSLKFSQQVSQKSKASYTNYIQLSIQDLDETLYLINIIEISAAQFDVITEVYYSIEIEFYTSLENQPILLIKLKEQLYNEYDSPLYSDSAKVVLQKPNYISATQKKVAGALQTANESSVKSLFALSFLLVILGDALSFMGILDILQEQSYLRFINVQYPQTILIYFESSKLVSLDSIFEFLSMTSLLNNIQNQFQTEESYGKFKYYQIDANVMTNFIGEAIIFASLLVTLICIQVIIQTLEYISKQQFLLKYPKIHKKLQQIQKQMHKMKIEIKRKGVKQTFFASSWDLILISFLQIHYYIHNYAQMNLQAIETPQTYFGLILSFTILGMGFYMISKYIRSVQFQKKRSLFKFWQKKGELFRYLKKFLILYILVFFQNHQENQTLLLTFINVIYIIYVYQFRPCKKQQDNYKTLAMEISKFIFFASTFSYWDILSNYFLNDDKIIISWIQISILVSSIAVFVIIEFYNLVVLIKQRIQLYQQKNQKIPLDSTPTSQPDNQQLFTFKASQQNLESEQIQSIFKRQKILSARLSKLSRKF